MLFKMLLVKLEASSMGGGKKLRKPKQKGKLFHIFSFILLRKQGDTPASCSEQEQGTEVAPPGFLNTV